MDFVIEFLFSIALFINAALFIPQAVRLYRLKNAENMSLMTFGGFSLIQIVMILHGVLHKDVLFMLGMMLSFVSCGAVTVQIIWYKLFKK